MILSYMNRTEVRTRRDGEPESRHLCQVADGELFFSAGENGVTIICLGKPVDGDLVRQIIDMFEPTQKVANSIVTSNNNVQPKKPRVHHTKSLY